MCPVYDVTVVGWALLLVSAYIVVGLVIYLVLDWKFNLGDFFFYKLMIAWLGIPFVALLVFIYIGGGGRCVTEIP